MMKAPSCHAHQRLVLDLALGRLSDDDAALAEEARLSCGTCRRWWTEQLESAPVATVDDEVAQVFARFTPPSRARRHVWLAAAAAVLVAVGAGALWYTMAPGQPPVTAVADTNPYDPSTIFANDLESGNLGMWEIGEATGEPQMVAVVRHPAHEPARPATAAPLFGDDLESGDLSSWS